ncbi:MAG: PKD domain-containing protein, partial [Anaerolineae bacterium]|nr:PKD domain-containing protein [Anaerolineae bacterium]
ELTYRHDKALAQQVIAQEMLALGASYVSNQWRFNGEPVEIILLIRVEDHRMPIGDYLADELESIGFTVDRQYKTSREASAIWVQTDPAEGLFHIYTGGWVTTEVTRDLSDNFAFFYTSMGLDWPLWQAYTPMPEFYELARQLRDHEFTNLEERRAMMAQALEWALEDSVRIWVQDNLTLTPRRAEVRYASDAYGGMSSSWLWPHTLERTGTFTRPLAIGVPTLFQEPWNPLSGASRSEDSTFINATSDNGVVPDPYTGLAWPQRIAHATVVAEAGLPISRTLDWVSLQFAPSIVIPADAWVDWAPTTEHFLTAAEVYTQPQSVRIKSVVTYPPELFSTVTWHDGSSFSIADLVLNMIITFDRDLATHIRGVRIVSQNPLVIETYTDAYQIDAERNIYTWWPTYGTGPGAWHTLALGLLVEANHEGAFTQWEADEWGVPWLDYANWPGSIPLERRLATAQAQAFIPYAPTLGAYITTPQAQSRWNALATWYAARGHFWVGTGPLYLEQALKSLGQLALRAYPAYPDAPDRWDAFTEAPLAEVAITGPNGVPQGVVATFDVQVTLAGAPYPAADIESVRYLFINAQNEIAFTGDATAVANGLWRVTLTAAQSTQLPLGGNKLEVIVSPKRIAIAAVATHAFETMGIRVLSVTPSYFMGTPPIMLTIGGLQFQAGAIAALVRDGVAQQLATTFASDTRLEAVAPAGLPAGTYAVRVINPDGKSDALLGGFTLLTRTAPVITGLSPQQGPNNIPITLDIYGSNFGPGLMARLDMVLLEGVTLVDSTHIRAVVPLNITPGIYTLIITNLDGQGAQLTNAYTALANIDDLYPREGGFWLDPVTLRQGDPITPVLGIVINRLGGTATLPNVPVEFSYQPTAGSAILIGQASTPPLAPNGQVDTLPLEWANLPAAGTYTLRAVIDPANTIAETVETNNEFTRTVIILPPLPDTVPPIVQSFGINTGEQHTAQRQVYFNVTAQDNVGGSGVTSLLYIEYVYIHSRGDWVPVATSGWLPHTEASAAYPWLLNPMPGVHYLRAWAADAAGNISLYWRAGFINLVPEATPASIARGLIHTYRFHFQTGQSLSLDLTSVTGDADVYVFAPDDSLVTHSFSENPVEGVSFTATRNGVYQVEIFGYVASDYTLQFTLQARAQSPGQVRVSASKTPRDAPLVSAGDSPEGEGYAAGVPSAPAAPAGPVCVAVTGISFAYSPAQPLVNNPVTFNATLAPAGATMPFTLTWTFGDGQSITGNNTSLTHTYTTAGDKPVQVQVASPCTPGGIIAQQTLTIRMRQIFLPLVMRSFP